MNFTKYHQAISFLESLSNLPNGKKNGKKDFKKDLKKFRAFLKFIDHPEKKLKFIHVAGTAGKGTVVNLIQNILTASGLKAGAYFSPHITTTIERIKIGDLYISPAEFVKLLDYLKPYLAKFILETNYSGLNYYEVVLAMAFLYFKNQKCDLVVLEVGSGGLYDITNVIPAPLISIITNINKDHIEMLGSSLYSIAKHKAGIIKRGSIFLTAEKRGYLIEYFKKVCQQKRVKFLPLVGEKVIRENNLDSFLGKDNLNLAITAAKVLKIPEKKIITGLKTSQLACRFEVVQKNPIVILDGAHNPAKINFLVKELSRSTQFTKSFNLLFGCANDKNAYLMLKKLLPFTKNLYFTRFLMPFRKTKSLKVLYNLVRKIRLGLKIQTFLDPWQALEKALVETKKSEILLVTGSFFLTGELRKKWFTEEYILGRRRSFKG